MALKELLTDAATDKALVTRLSLNPDEVMEEYSLSEEEKIALRSGDKDKITERLGGDELGKTVVVQITVWVL